MNSSNVFIFLIENFCSSLHFKFPCFFFSLVLFSLDFWFSHVGFRPIPSNTFN